MDKSLIEQEVEVVLSNLEHDLDDQDESTKEYGLTVNNIAKLHNILVNEKDIALKEKRNTFDENIRNEQLNLDKKKFRNDVKQKELDRELEKIKIDNQHQERMAELEVNKIKAKNESMILEQNQKKAENEFNANRRRDYIILGTKIILFIGGMIFYGKIIKNELRFERVENGIITPRIKEGNSMLNKIFGWIF